MIIRRLILMLQVFLILIQFLFVAADTHCELDCETKHYVDDNFINKTYNLVCNTNFDLEDIVWEYRIEKVSKNAFIDSVAFRPFNHQFGDGYSTLSVQILNKSYLTDYKIYSMTNPSCNVIIELRSKLRMFLNYYFILFI